MKEEVRILLTGDFCPQLRIEEMIRAQRYEAIFNELKAEFEDCDLSIVDLECPLLEGGTAIAKTGPNLKCIPEGVGALRYLDVDLVAMANNHIMDYGSEGLNNTLKVCRAAGIQTVGVGEDLASARKPFVSKVDGKVISILNITENEWSSAGENRPGANPLNPVANFNDIQAARRESDFVIIIFHGGNEFYELPSPRIKETFRFYIDAGASAVVAHHTHTVSGYEIYKGAPIFYSLGNFCFDWPDKRGSFWNIGIALRLKIRDKSLSFDIIPFKQNDAEPGLFRLTETENRAFNDKLQELNYVISDDAALKKRFEEFCAAKHEIYDLYLQPYRNPILQSLRKRKLIPSFLTPQKKRLILNITRCEAHRDVLISSLEK